MKLFVIRDIFEQLHTKEYKATNKQIVRLQLNEKVKRKPDKINELILKMKADLKGRLDNI